MRSALSDVSQERTDSQDILEAFEVLIRAI
jgi:hypothetical protein